MKQTKLFTKDKQQKRFKKINRTGGKDEREPEHYSVIINECAQETQCYNHSTLMKQTKLFTKDKQQKRFKKI